MLSQAELTAISTAQAKAKAYLDNLYERTGFWTFPTPEQINLRSQRARAQYDFDNATQTASAAIEGGDHELALKAIEQFNTIANGGEVPFKTPLSDAIDGIVDKIPTGQEIKDAIGGLVPAIPAPDLTWLKVTVVVIGLVALAYISRLIPRSQS